VLGSNFTLRVSFTEAVTRIVLISARATTHWVDGGPQRFLSLDFTQTGSLIEATVPSDSVRALAGYYILVAMVDDIPSVGRIVRITPTAKPRPTMPTISLAALDAIASEPGANAGAFQVTRTGTTNAPLTVAYALGGSAVNGSDYNALSNYVVIPAGSSNANITLTPQDDAFVEGTETVSLSLFDTAGYNASPATNAVVTLADNESAPPPLSLQLISPTNGLFDLTLTGPATHLFSIETSSNLVAWQSFASLVTVSNSVRLLDRMPTNAPILFFRARE
jgi:hypothetical protein